MPLSNILDGWVVIVVDDEEDSLEVAARLLEMAGATILTASNGREALEMIKTNRVQFVLSDLSMPEMDGWELVQSLQADARLKDLPVIALTAHTMPGDRERAIAAGFHNHISKPLDPKKFVTQLISLLVDVPELADRLQR